MGAPEERTSSGWWLLGPWRASMAGGRGWGALPVPGSHQPHAGSWGAPGPQEELDTGPWREGLSRGLRPRTLGPWEREAAQAEATGDVPPAQGGHGGLCPGGLHLCLPARLPPAGRWAAGTRPLRHVQGQVPPTEHGWPPPALSRQTPGPAQEPLVSVKHFLRGSQVSPALKTLWPWTVWLSGQRVGLRDEGPQV